MLYQLDSPSSSKKKKTDDSVSHTKTPVIAQKEPKTIARLQTERNPRTRMPDSEICPGNIIIGSPIYIPYKKILKNQKGQGKFGKKLKFAISSSSAMPKHKHTLDSEGVGEGCKSKEIDRHEHRSKTPKDHRICQE